MEYLSGYYWQQGEGVTSLVLKQLVYRKSGVPVLFGCMQSSGNGQVTEELVNWFYEEGVHLCEKRGGASERLELRLEKGIGKLLEGRSEVSFTVLFGAQECFWIWSQGAQKVYLLNSRFGRPHAKCIVGEEEVCVWSGELQQGVGILVATEDFCSRISQEQLQECLAVTELDSEERVQKRMDELGRKACQLGGQHVAAMLAVTC